MQSAFYRHIQDQENVTENINELFLNQTADWGPKRDPLYIVIPISVVYVAIFLTGILGNVSTCIVIARNKCMHTATNYYLFSLAISDLLLLVSGLPPEVYSIWSKYPYVFGEAFCVLQGFTAETSANATVLTITAFTFERYVAICHPFLSHTLSKLNRAVKYIILVWAGAMGLAIPQAMALGIVCEVLANGYVLKDHCVCMIKREIIPHAFLISTVVFFVAPMSLITVLYIFIGLQLRKSTVGPSRGNSVKMKRHKVYNPVVANAQPSTNALTMNRGDETPQQGQQEEGEGRKNFARNAQATKHVVKMLVAVVVAFFICWAPFHAQRLLAIYGGSEEIERNSYMVMAFQSLTYISGIFYYLSTTVNPLLYHIMSNKFRESFKKTYKQLYKKGHQLPRGRCYSTLSAHHQSNSDSYSGCGWGTGGGSLRYQLDDSTVAVHLHDHRRPLVVSFRRQKRSPQAQLGEWERTQENELAQSCGSPENGWRRDYAKGLYTPPSKLKNSFSFSSPLMTEKVVIERSRSFAKERSLSRTNFQDFLDDYKPTDKSELERRSKRRKNKSKGPRYRSQSPYRSPSLYVSTSPYRSASPYNSNRRYDSENHYRSDSPELDYSYVEVHTLRPKHICPLNNKNNILQVT